MDIGDNAKLFFKEFNIQEQAVTLDHREALEITLLQFLWPYTRIIGNEEIELFKQYSLHYDMDQWYAADAMEFVEDENGWRLRQAYRGEGDSFTLALLALLIEMKPILDEEMIEDVRKCFETNSEC